MQITLPAGFAHVFLGCVAGAWIVSSVTAGQTSAEVDRERTVCEAKTARVEAAVSRFGQVHSGFELLHGFRVAEPHDDGRTFRLQGADWVAVGLEPDELARSGCSVSAAGYSWVDVNCGCGG